MRARIAAWLTPEAKWARARTGVLRHPRRHALLLAGGCLILCINLWQAIRATSVMNVILNLGNAVVVAALAWYFWRIRQDAHLSEPPSWWRWLNEPPWWRGRPGPEVPPRS